MSYLDNLSNEQRIVFQRTTKNTIILASAGSGKTRTLTHLLLDDLAKGIPASSIIAFTFTEKAADELLARISNLCQQYIPDVSLNGIFIGTIHSWCLNFLIGQQEYYNVTPLDELQVDAIVSRFYDVLKIKDAYGLPYPIGIKPFLADLEIFYNENIDVNDLPLKIKQPITDFLSLLSDNHLIMFGEMIQSSAKLIKKNGGLTDLKCLYVDEYQDVNPAQVGLIKSMISNGSSLTTVGDDLQCIYNWRGSDVTRILDFGKDFDDYSKYLLTENYRSRPSIVQLANKIASEIVIRDAKKNISPTRPNSGTQETLWLSVNDEIEQTKLIAKIVYRLITSGIPENKITILLRSVLSYGKPIIQCLTDSGVKVYSPLLSRGGKFIDELLIPVIDWLRSDRADPRNQDEVEQIEKQNNDLWNSVKIWIPPDLTDPENVFWESLSTWYGLILSSHNDAYDVRGRLYDFLSACHISIAPGDGNLMIGFGIASQIIRSMEEVHRRRFPGHDRRTAKGIMNEVFFALIRNKESFGESFSIDENLTEGVLLTTIHQAKGLEWPIVIIPMLVEQRFPHGNTSHGTSFPDNVAGRYGTQLDDERRLFYVATTRAKERLFLIDPTNTKPKRTSTFLKDLKAKGTISNIIYDELEPETFKIDPKDLKNDINPPIRIGLSDLLIYIECPFQYGLRRIVSVQPSVGEELGFGKGLHELIQRHFEDKPIWTKAELNQQVENNVFLPLMSEDSESKSKAAIKERIQILEALKIFDAQVETELRIEFPIKNGIITGIIDLVLYVDDETMIVRDWKANIHENFLPRYERQLQFYFHALNKYGKNVIGADIVDIGQTIEQKTLITHQVDVSQVTINNLINSFETSIEDISNAKFHAKPSFSACSCCDMARICSEKEIGC